LTVTHEEADIIIANHVVHITKESASVIHVVCDDTDVFILLVHFYISENLDSDIFMIPTRSARNVINIRETANENKSFAKIRILTPF